MRTRGDVVLVCDDDDGVSFPMQPLEQVHYLHAGMRIECTGWLVGEKNRRMVD